MVNSDTEIFDGGLSLGSRIEENGLLHLENFIKDGFNPKNLDSNSESDGLKALERLALIDDSSSEESELDGLKALERLAFMDNDLSEDNLSESSENPSNGSSNYSEDQSLHRCPSNIFETVLATEAVGEWYSPSRYQVLEASSKLFYV